jgi:hypothetical protein
MTSTCAAPVSFPHLFDVRREIVRDALVVEARAVREAREAADAVARQVAPQAKKFVGSPRMPCTSTTGTG